MPQKIIFILFFCMTVNVFSQVVETRPPDFIKTISFKGLTPESQLPIIKLGSPLVLEFDVLNGSEDDYYYTITHYNYDWTPSTLVKSEYLTGIDNQRIRDYENSFNTFQIYSHYTLTIPNQQTRSLIKSGNYLISIFDRYGDLMFSRKFMVYENLTSVGLDIKRSRDVKAIAQKQSVDFKVVANQLQLTNPQETVKTVIIQNNNLNTAITGLKPQYILGNELLYKYNTETSFWGGNEYLFFENKDPRIPSTNVLKTELVELYHNYLYTNIFRANRPYTYNPDINGNFLITSLNDNTAIEADYVWVHFSLELDKLPDGETVYVYGNFNNYALNDTNRMTYNTNSGIYKSALKLKQGFYNYKYVVLDKAGQLNEGAISGNFYQTENNYKVLVYYRDLGARHDRLVGVGEGTSVNISN